MYPQFMKRVLVFLGSVWLCCFASAWDGNGHQLIAVIAHRRLAGMAAAGDARAKRALATLDSILATCPRSYEDIGVAATYSDDVKSQTHDYDAYHYNNVELSAFGDKWHAADGD